MSDLRKSIRAGVPVKVLRDLTNRLRYGADAPQSDELIWVRARDVTHWYKPDPENGAPRYRRRHSGLVAGGDWDQSRKPFGSQIKLDSIRDHFERGVPWQQTDLFDWMLRQIDEKGRIDGCHTREDLIARYERLDRIYEEAQRTGTLRPHGSVNQTRGEQGGILVHIARDGTPLRDGGGMHRFAIAYILDLKKVPAQLGVIHADAVKAGLMHELRTPPARSAS
ncbi:hypothetical protein [Marivita geojedonensis]|uniref:Uncharacterized protein n=1 Tax=Marivita geojedonensis TaxID=1123756 RepID=A0A1X4NMP8_9RHOB|nr:hypothetical protein [Marivita geojedonensis]OSQ51684.1 hypothetical protein MGEO_07130 [Marivita geojedonensis]PRY79224.1 hypothetical protein CLV76_105120 [Marivita geojedonensis]